MLSALITAGANLLGNLFNKSSQDNYNQQQMQLGQQNMAMQREFAQQGIRWKVADAQAAGLHPLAALGANTASFSPVSVGGSAPQMDFSSMGQDLSRAAKAMASSQNREEVDNEKGRALALEKAGLENDILRAELASKVNRSSRASGQLGPPMPEIATVPLPRPGPRRSFDGMAVSDDELKQKEGDVPAQNYSRPFGYRVDHAPWLSDAQVFEDRYGDSEIGSMAKGAFNLVGDHLYTGYKIFPRNWSIRGGDRSRWSRGQRNMRGGG